MLYKAGLVLEGGGMRGIYTAGVLDFMMEKELVFSECYGVSAGAAHLCSYISGQKGRAYHVGVDYLANKSYISLENLIKTGDLFGVQMCYDEIPNRLNPYDYEAAERYPGKAYAVVTNIETGRPEYIRLKKMRRDIVAVQASASLPLVSRNVLYNGSLYLDGGISDAVPIQRSILNGNRKNIVVLTKEQGYRRKPSEHLGLVRIRYAKYPKVYELMHDRHIHYNRMLDYLDSQVENGQAFVIRPRTDIGVGRIEKDVKKLRMLYENGYADAAGLYEKMIDYLNR